MCVCVSVFLCFCVCLHVCVPVCVLSKVVTSSSGVSIADGCEPTCECQKKLNPGPLQKHTEFLSSEPCSQSLLPALISTSLFILPRQVFTSYFFPMFLFGNSPLLFSFFLQILHQVSAFLFVLEVSHLILNPGFRADI